MDTSTRPPIRAALEAERTRLLGEIAETITAPGQMTYGSQAAAASQVFEQQRDLALRDRATSTSNSSTPPSHGSTPGRTEPAAAAASPIPADRLEALPWAAYDIECQRIVDRGGR